MTLLSLASRQVWPQVLAAAHFRPKSLILLHSDDVNESKGPAERLRRFFESTSLVPGMTATLMRLPHDAFAGIESRLDEIVVEQQLSIEDCLMNITGGNKLMATAALSWARRRAVRAAYLERDNHLTEFLPQADSLKTTSTQLQPGLTDRIDPLDLLTCQFGADAVRFGGERLTLGKRGESASDLGAKLSAPTRLDQGGFDFRKWLTIENRIPAESKEGDNLEYGVAVALLKAGVPVVRRSVELASRPGSAYAEGELDLVFNYRGRLWVVDCKDRVSADTKLQSLEDSIRRTCVLSQEISRLLKSIADDLRDREIKTLREDLLQVSEVGGLLGCALAVRAEDPPMPAREFAARRHPRVEIVLKKDLVKRLPAILQGRRAQ